MGVKWSCFFHILVESAWIWVVSPVTAHLFTNLPPRPFVPAIESQSADFISLDTHTKIKGSSAPLSCRAHSVLCGRCTSFHLHTVQAFTSPSSSRPPVIILRGDNLGWTLHCPGYEQYVAFCQVPTCWFFKISSVDKYLFRSLVHF